MSVPPVRTGLDMLAADNFRPLRGLRVGAIANPSSVDSRMRHLADLLHQAPGVELVALFGPEHGVRADAQDMIGVSSHRDSRTGVPVYSLYGSNVESLAPTAGQLDGLDLLLFDVQDVGSRYYTFAATMLYAMQAAARQGLRFLVLDRPNPIGGTIVEGPLLQPGFESFVGAYPLPIRHGMTVGELATIERAELELDLELSIVRCEGWQRSMFWQDTGLSWVLPSPNMPTPDTALVYPGGCLIEGTNLSEGRGTTRPFELWGAPWIDPDAFVDSAGDVPGALLRPCAFRPTFHKHAGQTCFGVQPHVVDPAEFRSVALYTRWLAAARAQDSDRFRWRTEAYEFITEPIAIDLLYGGAGARQAIEEGAVDDLIGSWKPDEQTFLTRREPHLLYR